MSVRGKQVSDFFRECGDCNKVWHISEFEEGNWTTTHALCPDCEGKLFWMYYGPLEVMLHYWKVQPAVKRYLASLGPVIAQET